ncbi:Metallo-dependent hydrolase [Corynespora cassiicola Philippines]|uniref:Metallo-dependent hydrolase n=1 Tax=Corynespora cassiicola Philippines TaxID=1448308 RepID=A0A2T2N392_CORCC|nr:Metallo-dependent hydrolase [Corynespora cassiicola Philippines]
MRTSAISGAFLAACPLIFANAAHASSILFTDATIISFDEATNRTRILENSSLLLEDDRISGIFETAPTSYPNGTEVVNATGKILSPGFVNTHHHLWQTALKTIASNTTLVEYYQRYGEFSPTIQFMTPEDKFLGTLTGALELLNSGTTTVLDHAHGDSSDETADAIFNATLSSGLRTFHAFTVHDIGNNYSTTAQMAKLASFASDTRLASNSLVELGLGYDFFAAADEETLSELWDLVQSTNLSVVTTHYLGGPWSALNSPELLHSLGWLNTSLPVVFSHASFITATDMTALRSTSQYISTTPESEMHYGHTHPYGDLIQDQAALGVDTHFTFEASMVSQARMWLQSTRRKRFEQVLDTQEVPASNPMSVEQAFYLMTRAGGLALRRPDLGVLVEGAKADVLVMDGDSPNMLGWNDPIAAVILHSNPGDVEGVVVGGQWAKRDGKLTYDGYADVKRRFKESAKRIQNDYAGQEWGPVDQGLFQQTSFIGHPRVVDTLPGDGTGY